MELILKPQYNFIIVPWYDQAGFLDTVFKEYEWDAEMNNPYLDYAVPLVTEFCDANEAFEDYVDELTSQELFDNSLAYHNLMDDKFDDFKEKANDNFQLFRLDLVNTLKLNHICFGIYEDEPLFNVPIREVW